ncbi:MAG: neurotransmitter-gated ion-channel ligand-binding domain-containing protein [Monoraphidium minutum]|nr:MAG: neurotransmitter-gated ion-channel ligand-binding domain-containing protein [Monoraphidium minutum]
MENSAGCFQQHSVAARPRRTARAPAGVLTTLAAALVLLAALALAAPLPSAAGAPAAASQPGGAADAGQAAPAPAAVAGANGSLRREKPQQVADAARRILPETQAEALIREALLDGYDALSFPWKQHGAANVSMNIVFNKVLNVDLYAGEMVVAVWFRLRWNDPRLMWDANATGVPYIYVENPEPDQVEIWTPDVTLWNAANDIGATLGLKRPQVSANGDVYWTRNGVIQVSCNFRGLEAYPFGPMSCWLEMGSWVLDRTHMDLWPYGDGASLGGSITGAGNARHVEYLAVSVKVERNVYGNCSFPPCTDEWPTLIYKLTIVRASVLYTFKILLPQIVLTMVAFSTFWLSPECGERLGLAITVPLAVAVYDLLVFNSLPTSNKISFVSAMGLLAFLFSIAVLVVNAIVIQLWFYREPRYMQRLSTIANTMLSFKEQSVWVDLLKVLQELKQELARRQHEALQEEEARTKSAHRLARRQKCAGRQRRSAPGALRTRTLRPYTSTGAARAGARARGQLVRGAHTPTRPGQTWAPPAPARLTATPNAAAKPLRICTPPWPLQELCQACFRQQDSVPRSRR